MTQFPSLESGNNTSLSVSSSDEKGATDAKCDNYYAIPQGTGLLLISFVMYIIFIPRV